MNDEATWRRSLPFSKRWLGYIAIKIVVLALAILVTLRIYGLV